MKIKNLAVGLLALTIGILHADLYDTTDELNAKYGEPVLAQIDGLYNKYTYKSGEYIIEARFLRNDNPEDQRTARCVYEHRVRIDGKAFGRAEIESILGIPKRPWRYTGNDEWRLPDINGIARYSSLTRSLYQSRR